MHAQKITTAVRLLGFSSGEGECMAALLAGAPRAGPVYFRLHDDSLQEPDIVLADGTSPAALAQLDGMRCAPPALLVGGRAIDGYAHLDPPVAPSVLHETMARLLAERRRALTLLGARAEPLLAERRRQPRIKPAIDGCAQRRQPPRPGKVLIVDKGGALRDHLARLAFERPLAITWTDSAPMAVRLCDEMPVSLAMINTAAAGIDPYALSFAIKSQEGAGRTAVVLLVGKGFPYDSERARGAGVRGLLDKPVGDRSLVAMLQRFV